MADRSLFEDRIYNYILTETLEPDPLVQRLKAETKEKTGQWAGMQIGADQGQFMYVLARLAGAKRCLEVGTFTGTSTLYVARALPDDGVIVACDVSEEWTGIGRKYWEEAGVAGKIDLRIAPATETLDGLIADGQSESFDLMFIDADKTNYDAYYERGLALLRPGGLMLVDNVLWGGNVADPENNADSTKAIRALNEKIRSDRRVTSVLVSIGDGLILAIKQ